MAGTEPIYYWDSCLFLAWIKDEERQTGDMDWGHETFETVMSCYRFTKNKKRISIPAPNGRCGNV